MKDLLEACLNGTKGIPPRLIRRTADIDRAEEHLSKAERNGMAMNIMYEKGFFDWSIVCAYYSMYHATLASLWVLGLDARSHECAIVAFEAFYVKKMKVSEKLLVYLDKAKQLSEKYADSIKNVKKMRIEASYGLGELKSPEASIAMSNAKEFVTEITAIVHEARGFGYIKIGKK